MSFDWKSYVDLSDELINHQRTPGLKEAYFRTAMSRAYYGVYGIACNFIVTRGIPSRTQITHWFIRNEYISSNNETERQIGHNLKRLWRRRIDADYEAKATINASEATSSLSLARDTFSNLQSIGAM